MSIWTCRSCMHKFNSNDVVLMAKNYKKGTTTRKVYYCKDCFNRYMQDKIYEEEIEKYLLDDLGFPEINDTMEKQLNELRYESPYLNNQQIYRLLFYVYTFCNLFNKNYVYSIDIVFHYIDEYLQMDSYFDLKTPEKDYFIEEKTKQIEIFKYLEEKRQLETQQKEENKIKKINNSTTVIHIQKNKIPDFFNETALQDYIANHLNLIEDGLKFIDKQVLIPHGIIDILAKDKDNKLCIIELKIDDNASRLIWQCTYYPTQFTEPSRMITVAPGYSERIGTALKKLGYVEEFIYNNVEYGNKKKPIKNLIVEKYNLQ